MFSTGHNLMAHGMVWLAIQITRLMFLQVICFDPGSIGGLLGKDQRGTLVSIRDILNTSSTLFSC